MTTTQISPVRICGSRIDLREIEPAHFAQVIAWRNDPDNSRSFFSHRPWTMEGQRRWYESYLNDPSDLMFIMTLKSGQPVGTVALYAIDRPTGTAEFGRVLNGERAYRRRGLASEACRLCLDYAFDTLNLSEVALESYVWNDAANQLYQRLGFVVAGQSRRVDEQGRSHDIYRMTLQSGQRMYRALPAAAGVVAALANSQAAIATEDSKTAAVPRRRAA